MKKDKIILWVTFAVLAISLLGFVYAGAREYMRVLDQREPFQPVSDGGDPVWSVHVLDVGQGDAIMVDLPGNVQMLVDGGVDDLVLSQLSKVMLPWDRSIDYIVITHPHADHINGLIDVLERYDVANVLIDDVVYDSVPYEILREHIAREGAVVIDPDDVDSLISGDVNVDVIYPSPEIGVETGDDVNEVSIVLKVYDGTSSILLTGDAGNVVEEQIGDHVGDIDILKVGHHGSKFGTSRKFLEKIMPEVAIISSGKDNSYGHPHLSTLKRLADFNVQILRTDLAGTINVDFFQDGYQITK